MADRRKRGDRRSAAVAGPQFVFRLFVAGAGANSIQARANLAKLCAQHLDGRSRTEVVDVLVDAATALRHRVLVTPTLMVVRPGPGMTLIGNLSDTARVVATLGLNGSKP